jgi:hypothetical protein
MTTARDKSRKDGDPGATASAARELSDRELEGVVGGVTAEPAPGPIDGIGLGDLKFKSK